MSRRSDGRRLSNQTIETEWLSGFAQTRNEISIKRLTPKIAEHITPLLDAAGRMRAACCKARRLDVGHCGSREKGCVGGGPGSDMPEPKPTHLATCRLLPSDGELNAFKVWDPQKFAGTDDRPGEVNLRV